MAIYALPGQASAYKKYAGNNTGDIKIWKPHATRSAALTIGFIRDSDFLLSLNFFLILPEEKERDGYGEEKRIHENNWIFAFY